MRLEVKAAVMVSCSRLSSNIGRVESVLLTRESREGATEDNKGEEDRQVWGRDPEGGKGGMGGCK